MRSDTSHVRYMSPTIDVFLISCHECHLVGQSQKGPRESRRTHQGMACTDTLVSGARHARVVAADTLAVSVDESHTGSRQPLVRHAKK